MCEKEAQIKKNPSLKINGRILIEFWLNYFLNQCLLTEEEYSAIRKKLKDKDISIDIVPQQSDEYQQEETINE